MGAAGFGAGLGSLANIGTTALMYKMYHDRNNPTPTPASPDNPVVTSGPDTFGPRTIHEVNTNSGPPIFGGSSAKSAQDLFNSMKRRPDLFVGKPDAMKDVFNQHGIRVHPQDLQTMSQELADLVDIAEARRKAALSRSHNRDSAGTSSGLNLRRPTGDF